MPDTDFETLRKALKAIDAGFETGGKRQSVDFCLNLDRNKIFSFKRIHVAGAVYHFDNDGRFIGSAGGDPPYWHERGT